MKVEIDKKSGFCFGVRNAVKIAEEALLRGEKVFSLGSIVHNDKEVERLSKLGLISVGKDEFSRLRDCNVLIRAHGEPPETYLTAEKNNIRIIEATCPIVKKLQSRIRKTWEQTKSDKGQIVIFGKPGHAEVTGLLGQTGNEGIIISDKNDIEKIDFSKPVYLFSQTTMHISDYKYITTLIRTGFKKRGVKNIDEVLQVSSTICGQVSHREPHLRTFARNHDVIIFVSGRESSNGRMLFAVCKEINPLSYFVSSPEEIDPSWFKDKFTAGICGATSTPGWLIEEVYEHILKLDI